jgi:hypothetical protein
VGAAGLTAAAVAGCQPAWPFDREKEVLEATGARAVFMSLPRGAATALSHDGSSTDDAGAGAGAGAAVRPSALRCLLLCRALHLVADADVVLLGAPTDAMAEDEEARFFRALRAEVHVQHNAHHCLFRPCFHDCFHLTPPPPHPLSVPPFHRLLPHRRLSHTPSWPRQASMGAGAGQRVVVVTASRLTAARHADRVVVLAPTNAAGGGAAVAQCGTFAELLAQPGPFRDSYLYLQERRMDDVEVPTADFVPRAHGSGNANGNGNGGDGEYFHSGGGGGNGR